MPRLSDIPAQDTTLIQMIYGGNGTGKSFAIGTCGDRSLIIAPENRLTTWQSPLFKKKVGSNPIIEVVSEGWLPERGATALSEIVKIINRYLDEQPNDFDFICIDGSTALRRFALNKALELNQKLNKSQTKGKLDNLNRLEEIELIDLAIQDRSAEMQMIENFFNKLIDVCRSEKKHLIVAAHERMQFGKPEAIGAPRPVLKVRPAFTGETFPDDIPGIFDNVWHMECVGAGDSAKYFARTSGDSTLVAKTTTGSGLFKVKEEDINFLKIIQRIREGK